MNAPMVGSWSVEVKAVKPFSIHGDLYFELHVVRLDDAAQHLLSLRVPQHAAARTPTAGDKLSVSFLMGQVTAAIPLAPA